MQGLYLQCLGYLTEKHMCGDAECPFENGVCCNSGNACCPPGFQCKAKGDGSGEECLKQAPGTEHHEANEHPTTDKPTITVAEPDKQKEKKEVVIDFNLCGWN